MRVLVCAFACNPEAGSGHLGGGESNLGWNIVVQLAKFSEVCVLTHADQRPGIERELAQSPMASLRLVYLSLPAWFESLMHFQGGFQLYAYLWQVQAFFVARRLHRANPFDLFHHVTYANDWMASFIGALLPVPYVRGPGGGAQRIPVKFRRQMSFRNRFWERVRAAGQWIFRHDPFFMLGQSRARALLVCVPEALEAIPQRWRHKAQIFPVVGVSSEDLVRIQSGAESAQTGLDCPSPTRDGKGPRRTFSVMTAGRLLQLKGLDLAIQAFNAFSERFPDSHLRIIGDGPEYSRLKSLIHKLRLEGRVQIEGWMNRGELLAGMAACDVFLFPSLRDGGGAVVVEAMAAGKPVICMDVAGPAVHVNGDCGIKVRPESPGQAVKDMAAALERLYVDEALRRRMGEAARERALREYHWDRLGERLQEIYRLALGSEECEAAEQPVASGSLTAGRT